MDVKEATEQQKRTYAVAQRCAMILAKHGDKLVAGQVFSPMLQPCAEGYMAMLATHHHVATTPDQSMALLLETLEELCAKLGLDTPEPGTVE